MLEDEACFIDKVAIVLCRAPTRKRRALIYRDTESRRESTFSRDRCSRYMVHIGFESFLYRPRIIPEEIS